MEYLDQQDAAEFLGVEESTLATWRSIEKGPRYLKQGKIIRYKAEDLGAWLEQGEVNPESKESKDA